jgi:hypothetical protein
MGQFRRTLDICELSEFALQNRRYTWSNEHGQPRLVRLDRVFCNNDWELVYLGYGLQALSSSVFDHCPLFLCHQEKPTVPDTFKFENLWPRVPEFMEVVQAA